jgi:uncharacterized protein (UPF0332 family)
MGRKHKGLLQGSPDIDLARDYITKAHRNLALCSLYRDNGYEYKIPEEWFYTLYYCALAILARFGVNSRSQRCTALFLRYLKARGHIDYDDEFIDRITVHRDRDMLSDVDYREEARYGASTSSEDVIARYDYMTDLCKKAIDEAEEIVYAQQTYR